jgi:uncharacterized protein YbaR (Trm112 family)
VFQSRSRFRHRIRVSDFDVLACPRCGGRLRVIATVQAPRTVQAILAYLAAPAPARRPAPPHPRPPHSRSPRPTSVSRQRPGTLSARTRHRGALAMKQDSLSLGAPAILARGPVSADHPMTRNSQRKSIGRTGLRHGSDSARPSNPSREVAISDRLPDAKPAKALPHEALEHRPSDIEGELEIVARGVDEPGHGFDPALQTLDVRDEIGPRKPAA